MKKGVLKNFIKFTGKHLCQNLFFNKVAGLRPATLIKKRLWHRCFPVDLMKFPRTPFYTQHLRWLLTVKRPGVLGHPARVRFKACDVFVLPECQMVLDHRF